MGILIALGALVSFILWNFFGYRWDGPLYVLRKSSSRVVYLGIIITSFFIGIYTFAPEKTTAEITRLTRDYINIPVWVFTLIAIVLTITANFAYHYKQNCGSRMTKFSLVTLSILTLYLSYFIYAGCELTQLLPSWINCMLGIWLGCSCAIIFHIESKLFLYHTQHVPI